MRGASLGPLCVLEHGRPMILEFILIERDRARARRMRGPVARHKTGMQQCMLRVGVGIAGSWYRYVAP